MTITRKSAEKFVRELCQPAYIFLLLSFVSLVIMIIQNYVNSKKNKYCVGMFECTVKSLIPIFLVKIVYIIFWTFILDLLCKNGYTKLSWFILLFPFIIKDTCLSNFYMSTCECNQKTRR